MEAGGIRVLIEPPSKESGLAYPRLKSDILIFLKSRQTEKQFGDDKENGRTFVVDSPGEYEIKGANISGIGNGLNTIYNVEIEGIKIAHLGFLNKEMDNEKLSALGDPDVILIPVGGLKDEILDAQKAMAVINQIEPKIVIPMLYDVKGLKIKRAPLSEFIKESESKDLPVPKFSFKKKDLVEEETKIVILEKI